MFNDRRNDLKGGKYFFTVALRDRSSKLLIERIELLREAVQAAQLMGEFTKDCCP